MYKQDFPIFKHDITYLDSAASTQKPSYVLDAMHNFYTHHYANVHKGTCSIALQATELFEESRKKISRFINVSSDNIIFTRGTTESINLVASSFSSFLTQKDEVLISISEHHANFVPWQQLCLKTGATLKVIKVHQDGTLDLGDFENKLTSKTKIVSITHLSNVLGVLNPVQKIVELSHKKGAYVLIDGAQSIAHTPIDISKIGCDIFVFSGHKLYGPTGIGVLYMTSELIDKLPPYQYGGDMIEYVYINETKFLKNREKFEAGTPAFVEAYGLSSAIDYLSKIGMEQIEKKEKELTVYLSQKLQNFSWIHPIGDPSIKNGLISFTLQEIHPQDLLFFLAKYNICLRSGHHCAMPIHTFFGLSQSLRVSLGLYNNKEDIDNFISALSKAYTLIKGAYV